MSIELFSISISDTQVDNTISSFDLKFYYVNFKQTFNIFMLDFFKKFDLDNKTRTKAVPQFRKNTLF